MPTPQTTAQLPGKTIGQITGETISQTTEQTIGSTTQKYGKIMLLSVANCTNEVMDRN